MEERIKEIMEKLDCSRDEAIEILKDDDAIEHGEKLFELTDEQKAVSKQARGVSRKPAKQKVKRERKPDHEKREIIQALDEAIVDTCDCVKIEVTNIERQIDWTTSDGRRFRVVLSCPRK